LNIDQPTTFIKNISVIVGIVIGGWFALEAIFVTRVMLADHQVEQAEVEIDMLEKRRDHYQNMIDDGKVLDKYEQRRLRVNNTKLDRQYKKLELAEQVSKEYKN